MDFLKKIENKLDVREAVLVWRCTGCKKLTMGCSKEIDLEDEDFVANFHFSLGISIDKAKNCDGCQDYFCKKCSEGLMKCNWCIYMYCDECVTTDVVCFNTKCGGVTK